MSLAKVMGDYKFLKWLLWNEFIFDYQLDDVEEVEPVSQVQLAAALHVVDDRVGGDALPVSGPAPGAGLPGQTAHGPPRIDV